jgi:hypothetical protein
MGEIAFYAACGVILVWVGLVARQQLALDV